MSKRCVLGCMNSAAPVDPFRRINHRTSFSKGFLCESSVTVTPLQVAAPPPVPRARRLSPKHIRYSEPMRVFFAMLASAVLALAQNRSGQPDSKVHSTLQALYRVHSFRGAAISPNGRELAWVETLKKSNGTDSGNSAIYVAPINNPSAQHRITAALGAQKDASESGVSWSPDSSRILFVSDAEQSGQRQIYVVEAHGGTPRKLSSLKGFLAEPRFSPDGKEIAFLFTENAPRMAGPLEPSTPEIGVIDQKVYEQRIAVLNAETGATRIVTPSDIYVYEYDWSPDGQQFAYTAAPGVGDNNWWVAQLYRIAANGSSAPELVVKPPAQIAVPRWSPDGQSIAFIGGIMSDEGSTGGDIYLAMTQGGGISDLTPGREASAAWLDWLSSGKLLFGEDREGGVDIAILNPRSREAEILWKGDEQIRFGGIAQDGKTSAVVRTSWEHAPEVWAGPLGDWRRCDQRQCRCAARLGQDREDQMDQRRVQRQRMAAISSPF